jgi:hypothetical protein
VPHLRQEIKDIFFHDESIKVAIKNCYLSMPNPIEEVIKEKQGIVDIEYSV